MEFDVTHKTNVVPVESLLSISLKEIDQQINVDENNTLENYFLHGKPLQF